LASAALLAPRTDLPPSYHHFADQRVWLSIPQFSDVASNIAFSYRWIVGIGISSRKSSLAQFIDARERWPYFLVFLGLVLTAFGSAYYSPRTGQRAARLGPPADDRRFSCRWWPL